MDIVLNGICKQSASYRKCLGKSSNYKRTSANGVVHRKKFSHFCWGGEGGRSVGQSCGSIRPTEKVKMEKGAKSPLSAMKKKELVALIKQSLGAIQQRKKTNGAKPFPPTRLVTI
jgi:hypothetical protein